MKSKMILIEIITMQTNGSMRISGRTTRLFAPRLVYNLRPEMSDKIVEKIAHPQLYSEE